MNELYWITRLDGVNALIFVGIAICIVVLIGAGIWCIIAASEDEEDDFNKGKAFAKKMIAPTIVCLMLNIFVPTTKDALMIYGVGGTLDYVKQNEKIQQLPDKVVDALDMWIDDYLQTDSVK